jgi:hypothetical protein
VTFMVIQKRKPSRNCPPLRSGGGGPKGRGGGREGALLKMERPRSASPRKRLWTGFATHCVPVKPFFNCEMPAQSHQGTFRFASLKALDPPELAAL